MDDDRSLNEDIYNAALMHALGNVANRHDLEDSAILDQYLTSPHGTVSKRCQRNMKRLLRQSKKMDIVHKHTVAIKRFVRPLAAVFVIVVMSSISTQASIFELFDWVFNRNNVYTSMEDINRMENECVVKVLGNSGWNYFYFPQNIPKDYTLQTVEASKKSCYLVFLHGDATIEFRQFPMVKGRNEDGFSGTYDNEGDSQGKEITIDGTIGFRLIKDNRDIISYDNDDYYFEFRFSGISKTDAIKIASNLNKITK